MCKASLRATLILNCFQSREPHLLTRAFCAFVRPILEYCSVIWSPLHKYNINKIEAVQLRFTKKLHGLHKLSYENRLSWLGLESLLYKRVKTDLVMCYKILHNLVNIDCVTTLSYTRGNVVKLNKPRIISTRDSHFFKNRDINLWKSLPDSIITAPAVNCVKRRLDKFLLWVHCFTARCYASAVLAMGLCLSLCLSVCQTQIRVLLKRLNVGSHKITPHDSRGTLVFWRQRSPRNSTPVTR